MNDSAKGHCWIVTSLRLFAFHILKVNGSVRSASFVRDRIRSALPQHILETTSPRAFRAEKRWAQFLCNHASGML
jgi:hypothetical protein